MEIIIIFIIISTNNKNRMLVLYLGLAFLFTTNSLVYLIQFKIIKSI